MPGSYIGGSKGTAPLIPNLDTRNLLVSFTSQMIHLGNDPSTLLWSHSPFWDLTSLRKRLHSSLSYARLLHPRIPRICDVSLRTTPSHLVPGFPTAFLLWYFPLRIYFGILPFSIFIILPPPTPIPVLLILLWPTIFSYLYKLYHYSTYKTIVLYLVLGHKFFSNTFLPTVHSVRFVICVWVQATWRLTLP